MPTPTQNIANALAAYTNAARTGVVEKQPEDEPQSGGFADMVKSAAKSAVKMEQRSETQTLQAIDDRTDLNQVVTAVAEAELTLQTVIAIRDKVIDAYREILRMPI